MRVAFLHDNRNIGGGGEYIRQLQMGLSGVESSVLYSSEGKCFRANVLLMNPDIVHINHLRALCQYFISPCFRRRVPVVFTVHGIHIRKYDFLPKTMLNVLCRRMRLLVERILYNKCDALIALTEEDARYLHDVYKTRTQVCIIPNGVSAKNGNMGKEKFDDQKYEYVSIARICLQKGQDVLLRAISLCQSHLRRAGKRTLIIGDGEGFHSLVEFARLSGISDIVDFAGAVPFGADSLKRGRILVAPSRWEGLPLLLCEAGLQQKFVIASDCPGNNSLIKHGESGLLFKVEDAGALANLLAENYSNEFLFSCGKKLSAIVHSLYSIENMVDGTFCLYRKLIGA